MYLMRQGKSTGIDAIDCFTNDLVVRKTNKWRTLKEKLTANETNRQQRNASASTFFENAVTVQSQTSTSPMPSVPALSSALIANYTLTSAAKRILHDLHGYRNGPDLQLCVNVQTLSGPHIDQLLLSALLEGAVHDQPHAARDFYAILGECVRWTKLPSDCVAIDCLQYLTRYAPHLTYADQLIQLIGEQNAPMYAAHAGFVHFLARARWYRGEHAPALRQMREAYATMRSAQLVQMADTLRVFLRETVEMTMAEVKTPTNKTVDAETVVELVVETAEYLSRRYGENEMLMLLWKSCFISEWFERQQRAVRMFNECEEIRSFAGQK